MTHRDVVPLLSDLLSNLVPEPQATEAWSHVGTCAECRQAVTAMHEVRAAVARGGANVFEAHPTSRDIVSFALEDPALSAEERSKIEAHVAQCASCSDEILLTRRAEAATRRPGPGPISIPGSAIAWLAPALAAGLIILAFPAYVGLARHPKLLRAHEEAGRQLSELKAEQSRLSRELAQRQLTDRGGAIRLLYLPATTRGVDRVPSVAILPDQLWQPVIVQHRPFAGASPSGRMNVEVIRESNGRTIWSGAIEVVEAWDHELEALALLIPAKDLEAGTHRIMLGGAGVVGYEGRFQVRRPRP